MLINAPTGAGKTIIGCQIIRQAVEKRRRVLFLAHRRELIDQCAAKLDEAGVLHHGVILSGHAKARAPQAPVQVASIQTLIRRELPLADLVIEGAPALIPTSIRLANAETELVSPFGTATVLKDRIAPLRERYDVILIDCPPQLSLLTVNALVASDAVLIPCKTDYLSIMGISLLLETIENTRRRANPRLRLIGILPTMFNARALHDLSLIHI